MSRLITTSRSDLRAECLRGGCGWSSQAANAQGNAARHHDATGHAVRVDVERTFTYGDPTATAIPGQVTLDEVLADVAKERACPPV